MQTHNQQTSLLQGYRNYIDRQKEVALGLLLVYLTVVLLFTSALNLQNSIAGSLFTITLLFILTVSLSPLCEDLPMIRVLLEITGLSMLALYSLTVFIDSTPLLIFATLTFTLSFFLSLMLLLFQQLFSSVPQKVKLLAALNFYLLTGVSFSFVYLFINLVDPMAFDLPDQTLADWPDYLYFSFVTLTTLGYGDILPVSELAKSLSNLEAIIGVLSPTVMIARFVSVEK